MGGEITCPLCMSGRLELKDGRYGDFWGCSEYPVCNYACDYDDVLAPPDDIAQEYSVGWDDIF